MWMFRCWSSKLGASEVCWRVGGIYQCFRILKLTNIEEQRLERTMVYDWICTVSESTAHNAPSPSNKDDEYSNNKLLFQQGCFIARAELEGGTSRNAQTRARKQTHSDTERLPRLLSFVLVNQDTSCRRWLVSQGRIKPRSRLSKTFVESRLSWNSHIAESYIACTVNRN